ncbi:DUF917 domain-containing protein [uncultured Roseobacter sp.]|uniref:DUF917 domain-containing protein n=1 Tax=uncultured Roseobacter sp. TaxID=114847 RepID=UPI002603CCE9|nr:DUF917 domain-containing protein [uncultured Roseobacter sp.]
MRLLTREDLHDILTGCTILGTGGGGDMAEGIGLIDDALARGRTFKMVTLDEAPPDALICTPYMLGAISPLPPDEEGKYARLPRIDAPAILLAYARFQEYLGQEFYGTVCCELGGSNTAVAFYAAAMSGHMIVDADPAGRAVPEITHSTYYINDLPAAPIVLANEFGEVMLLENIQDDLRAETIVRALSIVSRNDIAAIDHALAVESIRHALIPGTITLAQTMGRAHREAQAAGVDVAEAVAQTGGGSVMFRGEISACDWRTEEGFTLGSVTIAGSGTDRNQTYRIDQKNENLVGWLNDAVHATIPDLICLIDTDKGMPVTNPDFSKGMRVAVVILPAPAQFTTARGLAAFGPAYVGLDQPFTSPLMTLAKQ